MNLTSLSGAAHCLLSNTMVLSRAVEQVAVEWLKHNAL